MEHTFAFDDKNCFFSHTIPITLGPTDIMHVDLILRTNTAISPTIRVNENIRVMIAPNLLQDPSLHIGGFSLYNMCTEHTELKQDTFLFAISFENINSILAVPVQPDKGLRKASLHQNVLNFSFLDVLTKLLSRIGQPRLHEEKLVP